MLGVDQSLPLTRNSDEAEGDYLYLDAQGRPSNGVKYELLL